MLAVVGVLALVPALVRPYPQLDLPGGAGPARAVAYERNGNLLVGRPDGVVRRFAANGSDLRPIDSLRPPLTLGDDQGYLLGGDPLGVAVTDRGVLLALGSSSLKSGARVVRLSTDEKSFEVVAEGAFATPRFLLTSPDGQSFAVGGVQSVAPVDGREILLGRTTGSTWTIKRIDLRKTLPAAFAKADGFAIEGGAYSRDGKRIAVALSAESGDGSARPGIAIFDSGSGEAKGFVDLQAAWNGVATVPLSVAWKDDQTLLFNSRDSSGLFLWTVGQTAVKPVPGSTWPGAIGNKVGELVIDARNKTLLLDLQPRTGHALVALDLATLTEKWRVDLGADAIMTIRPREDGAEIALGLGSGAVKTVRADGSGAAQFAGAPFVRSLQWSLSGQQVGWSLSNGKKIAFDVRIGAPVRGEIGPGTAELESPMGYSIKRSVDAPGTFDLFSATEVVWQRASYLAWIDAERFVVADPFGISVVAKSKLSDRTTSISFNLSTTAFALSPDRTKLAVGLADGSVRIVSIPQLKEVLNLYATGDQDWVAFDRTSGQHDSSLNGDQLFGYQVQDGPLELAHFVPASAFERDLRYRVAGLARRVGGGIAVPYVTPLDSAAQALPQVEIAVDGLKAGVDGVYTTSDSRVKLSIQLSKPPSGVFSFAVQTGTLYKDAEPVTGTGPYVRNCFLADGENNVRVDLKTASGESRSNTIVIRYSPKNATGDSGKLHVIAFGIGEFKQITTQLPGSFRDAKNFAAAYADPASKLNPCRGGLETWSNSSASLSLAELRSALAARLKLVSKNDRVLLYFSTHGLTSPDGNSYFLATSETNPAAPTGTGLDMSQLLADLQGRSADASLRTECKSIVIVIDACYAANAFATVSRSFVEVAKALPTTSIGIIASSSPTEPSQASKESSLFTDFLLKVLREEKLDPTPGYRGTVNAPTVVSRVGSMIRDRGQNCDSYSDDVLKTIPIAAQVIR